MLPLAGHGHSSHGHQMFAHLLKKIQKKQH
jgi:hypothetical protein